MALFYVGKFEWQNFVAQLTKKFEVLAHFEREGGLFYQPVSTDNFKDIVYNRVRAVEPLKSYLFPPKERVVGVSDSEQEGKRIIMGAKACDLKSLQILDKVFLEGDFLDPFYKRRRESTILISGDCMNPNESCFCNLVEGKPFPEEGFDINLSWKDDGFLVEVGSPKGERLIKERKEIFREPTQKEVSLRQERRETSFEEVKDINREFLLGSPYTKIVASKSDSPAWKEGAEDCVECGACTNICPTCHCYLLDDVSDKQRFVKVRNWDSCQHTGYARVAAGLNPRPELTGRFKNRYLCKFRYLVENFGLLGCTGCGRCVEACQGKIDIREVLAKVASGEAASSEK